MVTNLSFARLENAWHTLLRMITPDSPDTTTHDHGFQIAPMVDVVFVLLLFFMACAGMRQVEGFLGVDVPGRGGEPPIDPPLVFDISPSGEVFCNGTKLLQGEERDGAVMREWVRNVANAEPGTPVIIRAAGDTTHERFILVLSVLQQSGIRRISFA